MQVRRSAAQSERSLTLQMAAAATFTVHYFLLFGQTHPP